jgi:hypothetical protein
MKEFKIRASAGSKICTAKSKPNILPVGAKTYCEQWVKQQIYQRRKEFTSKFTAKGEMVELESFKTIGKHLKIELLVKNDEYFENDFASGSPDCLPGEIVIDAKNSWDCFSFPLFDDEIPNDDNYYQGQIYMWLTGLKMAKFVYVLSDTPEKLIQQEAKSYCYKAGYDLTPEIVDEMRERMTYANIPDEYKIKVFDVVRNDDDIEFIKQRVILCREYIKTLVKIN